ncbi:serine/threonine protein kinase [Halobellus rufus]|uniref:serine/threonine protein kinase n=1 Tax=Halobellus rufus TaxID=1448860 RepID=UPI000678D5BF|nr:FHA domain-containing protein [Halobellus rufus]
MHWAPDVGDRLVGADGEYELVEYIDTGGFTTVYRATETESGADVCIKYPFFGSTNPDIDAFVSREVRALRTIETLGGHANIMTLHEHFVERGTDFLVVDYVDGAVLSERTERFDPSVVRSIGLSACSALGRLHTGDIVYRDLKEDNLILTGSDRPVLIDLNTCRVTPACPDCGRLVRHEAANSATCEACDADLDEVIQIGDHDRGRYKAPEQRDPGRSPGPWTDVYALGRVLFRLLAGFVPPREFDAGARVDAPAYLTEIIDRATDPDPEQRYPDALALGDALYRRDPDPGPPSATVVDPDTDAEYAISPGDRIGRVDETTDPAVPVADDHPPAVSRQHAQFALDGNCWELIDTGRNGTLVGRHGDFHRVLSRRGRRERSIGSEERFPERRRLVPGDVIVPVDERYGARFRFEGRPWVNV